MPLQFTDERELLSYAIHKEESAHRFYRSLAETIQNPEAAHVFADLAVDEANHRRQLEKLWNSISPKPFKIEEKKIDVRHPVIHKQAGAVQALDLALDAETAAAKFYELTSQSSQDPALRRLSVELAKQEWGHYETLSAEKNAIIESFYWFDMEYSAYVED